MRTRGPSFVWGLLGFVIGMLPAFLFAGPALFSAASSVRRWEALVLYAAALLVLGLGGGALAGSKRLAISIGLALPIVAVLVLTTWGALETYLLAAAFAIAAAACSYIGVTAGNLLTAAIAARRRG
jgi:hypothetical protein